MSASVPNAVASHRHEAAATKVARAYANKLYGNTAKIYSYFWGCSGGGVVSMAAAENTVGIWDGIQPQCIGNTGDAMYHSFFWQAHYTMAIPQAKRDAIAAAAAPGGTGDIYAGLNDRDHAMQSLHAAFRNRHPNGNESLPDPRQDVSFRRFMLDPSFRTLAEMLMQPAI